MLMKDDPEKQLVYYQVLSFRRRTIFDPHPHVLFQAGIGTYTNSVVKTPILETMAKFRDKMFARTLSEHVKGLSFPPRIPSDLIMTDQLLQADISI